MDAFRNLGLDEDLLKSIEALGFTTPTPVQEKTIPLLLQAQGDVIALAQTGTGKTAAFGLPLLQHSDPNNRAVQGLVLCPTRELCVQVASDLENYSKFAKQYKVTAVYGGASIETQIRQIKAGTQIIVATPGRLIDLAKRKAVNLEQVKRLVLDEADEMLNMGFKEDIDVILESACNVESVWLFSATMSNEVRAISRAYMKNPTEIVTGTRNVGNENIEHLYYVCRPDDRYSALKRVVDSHPDIFGLIFCRTKAETKEIADQMMRDGYDSESIHGDLSQNDRDRVMNRFREKSIQLLIATDVAARGIDVSDITHVIHYGLPDDIEVYTHRSGRTGRAGKTGVSITITTPKHATRIRDIERMTRATIKKMPIPTGAEICQKQLFNIVQTIHDVQVQEAQIEPFLPQIYEALNDLTKEELVKRFASMEFNRFLSYYKDAPDLNVRPKTEYSRDSRGGDSRGSGDGFAGASRGGSSSFGTGKTARLFANIGEMDGVFKKGFIQFVTGQLDVPATAIGQIDVKKSFMHFDVDRRYVPLVIDGMQQMSFNGRKIRVDEADDRQGRESSVSSYGGGPKKKWEKAR